MLETRAWLSLTCASLALAQVAPSAALAAAAGPTPASAGPAPSIWSGQSEPLRYLGELQVKVRHDPALAGLTPWNADGAPLIGRIEGGTATGPVLHGQMLPTGESWGVVKPDGRMTIKVNLILKTDDGATVVIHYESRWKSSSEVFQRVLENKPVQPTEYYLRSSIFFEAMDPRYAWLNDVVAVGYGAASGAATVRVYALR